MGSAEHGQTGGKAGADIKAPAAWEITTGSSDVVVAIIDTGIDYTHPDLASNMWTNVGIDVVNNDSDPFDDYGHGTHVAGTIGALGNNGTGVVGVNWHVKLTACKFLGADGSGSSDGAIQCLEYIKSLKDSGANIVATNNSSGGESSQALYDAINAQRDILFIAAAGNSGLDTDATPHYPACYKLPNIISVVATDHNDMGASFTNYGRRSAHLSAPGVNILSTLPAVNAFGMTGGYGLLSGTSMATPHVTGVAALIKAQNLGRDWIAIKNLLLSGGDNIFNMYKQTITGTRINALGSLTCSNKPAFSVLQYPAVLTVGGVPVTLSATSINCEAPAGPVTVTLLGGEVVTLADNGVSTDLAAGDGVFTASWTPTRATEVLRFSSPAGSETIEFPPFNIGTTSLPTGSPTSSYEEAIAVTAGYPPMPGPWSLAPFPRA